MRVLLIIIPTLAFLACSMSPGKPHREAYGWIDFEKIPADSMGKCIGKPSWDTPFQMKFASIDTFLIYENNDSILMITPDAPPRMFRKVQIKASKWKPRPDYANKLFLLGTYIAKDLGGLYFSFYSTKDRSSLLEIDYTNPGNMNGADIFTKDSVNILQKDGIIIDPRNEQPEMEEVHINSSMNK